MDDYGWQCRQKTGNSGEKIAKKDDAARGAGGKVLP
jgi:hypothetical protein